MRPLRLAWWGLRVGAAAVTGACLRLARRVARRPPRIWHGPTALFFTKDIARAERLAGFPTRSVAMHTRLRDYALVRREDFDAVFDEAQWHDAHWLALMDLLREGDIWFAHFDSLFFGRLRPRANALAMRLIRFMGIRIFVAPHGGDVLYRDSFVSRYDWIGRAQRDYADWDLTAEKPFARQRIDLFCRHAHVVHAGDSSLARFLPRADVRFPYLAADTDALQPAPIPPRAVPRVVHAPNHRLTKGTDHLLAAIEHLRRHGIECELLLVEKVPRHEALRLYATADIIADQFIIGGWGVFASEAMALGKPVLTYLDEDHLGDPAFNHPIVNTTPDNIERVLAVLLTIPELRARIGRAARASVERYQSIQALAPVWQCVHAHIWWHQPLDIDRTNMFGTERAARVHTEDPARCEFWPVEVDDLMPRIVDALSRVR
jgi:glycosyltransferase involved in cell wall biosynthesis